MFEITFLTLGFLCPCCACLVPELISYHQQTCYQAHDSNWVILCAECKELNDEYWADLWRDYYVDRM